MTGQFFILQKHMAVLPGLIKACSSGFSTLSLGPGWLRGNNPADDKGEYANFLLILTDPGDPFVLLSTKTGHASTDIPLKIQDNRLVFHGETPENVATFCRMLLSNDNIYDTVLKGNLQHHLAETVLHAVATQPKNTDPRFVKFDQTMGLDHYLEHQETEPIIGGLRYQALGQERQVMYDPKGILWEGGKFSIEEDGVAAEILDKKLLPKDMLTALEEKSDLEDLQIRDGIVHFQGIPSNIARAFINSVALKPAESFEQSPDFFRDSLPLLSNRGRMDLLDSLKSNPSTFPGKWELKEDLWHNEFGVTVTRQSVSFGELTVANGAAWGKLTEKWDRENSEELSLPKEEMALHGRRNLLPL